MLAVSRGVLGSIESPMASVIIWANVIGSMLAFIASKGRFVSRLVVDL